MNNPFKTGDRVVCVNSFGAKDLGTRVLTVSWSDRLRYIKVEGCADLLWASRFTFADNVDTPPNAAGSGRKDDTGKLDITLLFDDLPHALEAVAEVLQWAITKKQPTPYERGSWQRVSDFQRRYRAAQLRHQLDAAKAAITHRVDSVHTRDVETGLLQLAHIATDALFQLEMAVRDIKEGGSAGTN